MRSLYPAFAGLRFRRSPERTFVSSGGRLRRFGAAQCPSSEPTGSDTACLFCGTWKTKFNQSLKGVINNLFNEEYQSVLSRPMPRLNYEIFLDIRPKWGKRNKKQ